MENEIGVINKIIANYRDSTPLVLNLADHEGCEIRATAWSEHIDAVNQMVEVSWILWKLMEKIFDC